MAADGVGLWGRTDDKVVTFFAFGLMIFFTVLVIVLSLWQGRLETRKERMRTSSSACAARSGRYTASAPITSCHQARSASRLGEPGSLARVRLDLRGAADGQQRAADGVAAIVEDHAARRACRCACAEIDDRDPDDRCADGRDRHPRSSHRRTV